MATNQSGKRMLAFVGSYAGKETSGIYVYELDGETGGLTLLDEVSGYKNPSFLEIDPSRNRLYAIEEVSKEQTTKGSGGAAAFSIDPATGKLTALNRSGTTGVATCHIKLSGSGRYLAVASYSGCQVGLLTVAEDGSIGKLADIKEHSGSSVNKARQEKSHPHSVFFTPTDRYALVPDLGIDQIVAYRIDTESDTLVRHGSTAASPGAGPRHLAIHSNGAFVYCINELNGTITAYRYDEAAEGLLREIGTYPTLPEDFQGESTTAEVRISPNGGFLYGSNRGHDSIACYSIDRQSGALTLFDIVPSGGGHPRNFGISPDGRFLLAANRDGNNIVSFRIDEATGRLSRTGQETQASQPVCVQIVRM
jgi:6-phosphogluconolactonase